MSLITFPILQTARKSGLSVGNTGKTVHINCPFCGESKRRLYLYPEPSSTIAFTAAHTEMR